MDVGGWLRSLGLGQYEAAFRENEVDGEVLPNLTAEDLKDLGVARRPSAQEVAAIAELAGAIPSPARSHPPTGPQPRPRRRRAAPAHGDVLRSRRLDSAVGAARSRGHARRSSAPIIAAARR